MALVRVAWGMYRGPHHVAAPASATRASGGEVVRLIHLPIHVPLAPPAASVQVYVVRMPIIA